MTNTLFLFSGILVISTMFFASLVPGVESPGITTLQNASENMMQTMQTVGNPPELELFGFTVPGGKIVLSLANMLYAVLQLAWLFLVFVYAVVTLAAIFPAGLNILFLMLELYFFYEIYKLIRGIP